jgi:type IV secretion system protein VirD4
MDEFPNMSRIDGLEEYLQSLKSYNTSCIITVQSIGQLKRLYEKEWDNVIGGCDTFLFMGSHDQETCEFISTCMNPITIHVCNCNVASREKCEKCKARRGMMSRQIFSPNELMMMPIEKCLIMIRGRRIIYDKKYDVMSHKNYKKIDN